MVFRKDKIIYESKTVKIYISKCRNKEKKTKTLLFTIRMDNEKVCSHYLGSIEWDGAWWQYVFCPDKKTKWSAGCQRAIADFCEEQTKKLKGKWRSK